MTSLQGTVLVRPRKDANIWHGRASTDVTENVGSDWHQMTSVSVASEELVTLSGTLLHIPPLFTPHKQI